MWSKLDDQFYLNPKTAAMDQDEQDLYIAGIIYCNGQLTDGFIPSGVLIMLCIWAKIPIEASTQAIAQAIATRLVEHGFWEIADSGYTVHDFLEWNPSRDEVIALRNARSEAGRRGGKKSSASKAHEKASAQAVAQAKSEQSSTPSPSPSPSPDLNPSSSGSGGGTDAEFAVLVRHYEQNIGVITPQTSDMVGDDLKEFGLTNCMDAIGEAVRQNIRKWSYVQGILRKWKTEGRGVSAPSLAKPPSSPARPAPVDARRAGVNRFREKHAAQGG